MADTLITADPIIITVSTRGIASHFPPAVRDEQLDQTLYLAYPDSRTGLITVTMHGEWLNKTIYADPIEINVSVLSDKAFGLVLNNEGSDLFIPIKISIGQDEDGDGIAFISGPVMYTEPSRKNWVKWSDIGSANFTIGRSNVAGERPLDWQGFVYQIKKLTNRIVAYGQNGVSILPVHGTVFGLNTIYRIGLLGKGAVTGDDTKHFFIDNEGKLWKLSDGLELYDFSEYLSVLEPSVQMHYDALKNRVFICDGASGFVFDVVTKSLGQGPVNITGLGYKDGVQIVTAPATVVTPPFEICTDIYDLGLRAGKTIFNLEFGTNVVGDLYAAIDYRRNKASDFVTTPWYLVSSTGEVVIRAWAREFRFRAKLLSYEYFELDYIRVVGVADAH